MLESTLRSIHASFNLFATSALLYGSLALVLKRGQAFGTARRAFAEIRTNVAWYFLDAAVTAQIVGLVLAIFSAVAHMYSLAALDRFVWNRLGGPATLLVTVFAADFISYWRHRLEHSRLIWPAHAIHHSDTQMTWLTLARFHPVNRLVTASIDIGTLTLLGFPAWAVLGNEVIRHFYGEFIHADVPWTYGWFGNLFVSPVMHQWHHARDVEGAGSNFATVFSVFDRAFGTRYVPGVCTVPLGVTEDVGTNVVRQFLYPFAYWFGHSDPAPQHAGPASSELSVPEYPGIPVGPGHPSGLAG